MNRDYTYCIGACEPLCKKCKRHYPPSVPLHPDQIWWMAPQAKNNECECFDPKVGMASLTPYEREYAEQIEENLKSNPK